MHFGIIYSSLFSTVSVLIHSKMVSGHNYEILLVDFDLTVFACLSTDFISKLMLSVDTKYPNPFVFCDESCHNEAGWWSENRTTWEHSLASNEWRTSRESVRLQAGVQDCKQYFSLIWCYSESGMTFMTCPEVSRAVPRDVNQRRDTESQRRMAIRQWAWLWKKHANRLLVTNKWELIRPDQGHFIAPVWLNIAESNWNRIDPLTFLQLVTVTIRIWSTIHHFLRYLRVLCTCIIMYSLTNETTMRLCKHNWCRELLFNFVVEFLFIRVNFYWVNRYFSTNSFHGLSQFSDTAWDGGSRMFFPTKVTSDLRVMQPVHNIFAPGRFIVKSHHR